jgi:hypothetical protein
MRETIVLDVRGGASTEALVEEIHLDGGPLPNGFVIIERVDEHIRTLQEIADLIDAYYRSMPTLLVAIDEHPDNLREASRWFDTTLAVSGSNEDGIDRLEQHFPNLLREGDQLGQLGSIRTFPVSVRGLAPDAEDIREALQRVKGRTYHKFAEQTFPSRYAYVAPGPYANPAERILNEMGQVIDRQTTSGEELLVTSFAFEGDDIADADRTDVFAPEGADDGRPDDGGDARQGMPDEEIVRREFSGESIDE